ncbi:unnamed protein product [Blepharisma stoltei]|uniref:protein-tyrosine-phosphatase n=1 Tax=Blepharisma stoltei TaxID=1481888 RepID=A0AAU9K6X4_9CILI|nr:unnamed protein product [Blepharisma stoltei]
MQSLEVIENLRNLRQEYLFNLTQNFRKSLIVFEIRQREKFDAKHLKESLHIPVQPPFSSNFTLKDICSLYPQESSLTKIRRYCIIIGSDVEGALVARNLENLLKAQKCREVHLFDNEYEEFLIRYPFLAEGFSVPHYPCIPCGFPNEIIPKFLYLGNHEHAENYDVLRTLGITHVLNSTKNVKNAFKEHGIRYCRVFVEDSEEEKIHYHFQKAFKFIDEAKEIMLSGGSAAVLVHCAQGISRSATIVTMFLMKEYDIPFEQCVEYLKSQRYIVEPNQGFIKQLKLFEARQGLFTRSNTIKESHRRTPPKRRIMDY